MLADYFLLTCNNSERFFHYVFKLKKLPTTFEKLRNSIGWSFTHFLFQCVSLTNFLIFFNYVLSSTLVLVLMSIQSSCVDIIMNKLIWKKMQSSKGGLVLMWYLQKQMQYFYKRGSIKFTHCFLHQRMWWETLRICSSAGK